MENFGPQATAVLDAVERLRASLAVARGLVLAGRAVDLDGLDREAARLSAAAACADRAAHPALRDALTGATQEVGLLQATMRGAQ